MFKDVNSTGGTVSIYLSGAYSYVSAANVTSSWLDIVRQPFDDLAEYKLQRKEIPIKLDKLYQGLGNEFSAALQSTDKAKSKLELHHNGIMAMRSFLQSFWGNLIQFSRQTKPVLWRGFQKRQLKQSEPRDKVAKSLSNHRSDERKLVQLFQDMAVLHDELSNPPTGKNLGLNDSTLFNTLFSRWLFLIDDIVKLLQISTAPPPPH